MMGIIRGLLGDTRLGSSETITRVPVFGIEYFIREP